MTPGIKINGGPSAFDMAANLFRPTECELVRFLLEGDSEIFVSINCARSLCSAGHWWELELYIPFPQAHIFVVRYNCHSRKGEVQLVRAIEPELDHELERAEHAMAHGVRTRSY